MSTCTHNFALILSNVILKNVSNCLKSIVHYKVFVHTISKTVWDECTYMFFSLHHSTNKKWSQPTFFVVVIIWKDKRGKVINYKISKFEYWWIWQTRHSMARANLNKSVWLVINTTTAWKLIPHRYKISKNWNPPHWVHRFFKNWFLLIQKQLYSNYIQTHFTK